MNLKPLKSIGFGIAAMTFCCIVFILLGVFPSGVQTILKIAGLSLLAVSIIACMFKRFIQKKHKWTIHRTGDLFLHSGILLVLAAGLMGMMGTSTTVQLAVNQSVDLKEKGFPVTITLADARTESYPDGTPRQFFSTIKFNENGTVADTQEIWVNHPANYKGIKVYQKTMEHSDGIIVSGLTVKNNPGLILLWPGLLLTGIGALAVAYRR